MTKPKSSNENLKMKLNGFGRRDKVTLPHKMT